ncbi:hypothetical protein [Streptomyces cucumeris]|nr:hypothetical protein [Streptomyces sp. NEAU-Y11]
MTDLVERLIPEELWTLSRRVVPPTFAFVGIAAALIGYCRLTS